MIFRRYIIYIICKIKSKRQLINTINFYLHDISTPLVGVVFKHRLNTRTVNIQMLDLESALRNQRSHCKADMTSN